MQIRVATKADISAISDLICTLVTKYVLPSCSTEGAKILLNSMSLQSVESYFDLGYQYSVAVIDEQIIGVVALKNNSHLYHLFVAESHQGQGIAKQLWEQTKVAAINAGNPGTFTVNSALNAAALYRKWGFVDTQEVRQTNGIKDIPMRLEF